MPKAIENNHSDLLSVTAFFSVLLHVAIILGISFKLPDIAARSNTDNQLEVVLVTSKNNQKTEDAELISSNDNAGGGNDDREGSTPLPYKEVTPSSVRSVNKTAKKVTQTVIPPDQLLFSETGDLQVQKIIATEATLRKEGTETGRDKITTLSRQAEIERLLAKTSKDWENYQKRPRKKFLGPNTKGNGAAQYLNAWKNRVVEVGNADYPTQIKTRKLHGTLIVSIEINSNGTLNSLKVIQPSPHKLLNDAALRIVRDASPFASFPNEPFFEDTNILVITRAFHFLPDNSFDSTARDRG